MKSNLIYLFAFALLFISCSNDDDTPVAMEEEDEEIVAPATYSFTRAGESTVSFSGQTTRILMAEELISLLKDVENLTSDDEQRLLDMFANENSPFDNSDLNASDKSIKSKTAASEDYFSNNAAASATIKADFESYITDQLVFVVPNRDVSAEAGVAGQILDGSSVRYVNGEGIEYDQIFTKGLLGALMADQALNNYLGVAVLDAGTNVADNDNEVVVDGKSYTNMEHKWDEAYGYLYGTAANLANPIPTVGDDDNFLNKYIGRVEGDPDYAGISQAIFDALKLGRAAIVGKDYVLRDEQAQIARELISRVIAVRAIYYLQQGKLALQPGDDQNIGGGFHDLSEGIGFVYSLQFTRKPGTNEPYFTKSEVDNFLNQLTTGNGFWEFIDDSTTLDTMSSSIADRFGIIVEEAASTN